MRRVILSLLTLGISAASAADVSDYYEIETIPLPDQVVGEIGGLDFLPDGRLAAAFFREGIFFYDPETEEWTHFAHGLHEPLGIHAVSEREVVVMQRPELTRVLDTDGDGQADTFETICDDFGMSGNYHEFAYGPAVGPDGAYYVALNTASSGAGIFKEVRGEFREEGRPGRMYACVPYRGWVLRIDPETGEMTPWASGFRSPNGIGFDADGNLFVPDNQGDWVGTSPVHHVEKGRFYGHVSSLVWREEWDGTDPLKTPTAEHAELRTRPAVQFPHGVLANSPTQVIGETTAGKFGPFAGQVLVGEMNHAHIIRLMLEEVDGELQGAATTLIAGGGLPKGINRFAFDESGALWVGHTKRDGGWGGGTGLRKITWTGETPLDVLTMKLTSDGFDLTFTRPLDPESDAGNPEAYEFQRYYYEYHRNYGSDRYDLTPVPVQAVSLSENRRTVSLQLEELKAGYVYDLKLSDDIRAENGVNVLNRKLYYNCNRLLDGTRAPSQIPGTRPMQKVEPAKMTATDAEKVDGALVYEAEAANLLGPRQANNNEGFTGKGYADYQGKSGESIVWLIDIEKAGSYELLFQYALGDGSRPLELILNEEAVGKEPLPFDGTGSWTTWKTQEAEAELKKGRNLIQLRSVGSSGPNVDHLRVRLAN